jgi:hypothetical protein
MGPHKPVGHAINRRQVLGVADDNFAAQGMIAPTQIFVDREGALTPASFRFLFSVFLAIARIEQRLDAAGIPRAET